MMRRREFIATFGGAAAAWPLAARAQQPTMPVIGFLNSGSSSALQHLTAAFRQGLNESGYIEDRNVAVEYRWANGDYSLLPALAADLLSRPLSLMVAAGDPKGTILPSHGGAAALRAPTSMGDKVEHPAGRPRAQLLLVLQSGFVRQSRK